MMWTRTKFCSLSWLLLLLALSVSPCIGYCSESNQSADSMTISKTDWTILQQSNEMQRKALDESLRELSAVKKAQEESETALTEARTLLATSQMESDEMTKLCMTLLTELQTQKAENARLMLELKNAKAESATASDAITKANKYLIDTKAQIEANEAAWRKRETQLERQRLFYQILSVLAVGGGIALAT